MTYLYLTLSLFWFPPQLPPDDGICDLVVVGCYEESKEYIQEYIRDEFNKNGLDGDLAVRLVKCESNFKSDAISPTDDWGYFQWHRRYWSKIIDECFGKDYQLECEVRHAINKIKADGGMSAWSCNKKI